MKVLKFGGTSVGTPERMRSVANLINNGESKIVVLSAMSGTTDRLVEISDYLYKNNYETANELIYKLEAHYEGVIEELYNKDDSRIIAHELIKTVFDAVKSNVGSEFSDKGEKMILAQGEIISTGLFDLYLKELKIQSQLLPSLEYMKTNQNKEPDYAFIKENLNNILSKYENKKLFITQGYICRNIEGDIDNLQRGGSDYTASIIGNAIKADEIQIWTDIDGIHNNDPRIVANTKPIPTISFDEAAELAYFGAKILHPSSILPAKFANIPVRLKNTMNPDTPGTVISKETKDKGVRAVAVKDGITRIRIQSGRMLLAYGFLRKVFEIFEKHETSIDMITTSEVGVSVTIDNDAHINKIKEDLKQYGSVNVDDDQVIVCVVGYLIGEHQDAALKILEAMHKTPIQMISYGGSDHNISFLVPAKYKKAALEELHKHIF
jgi:aspartate kinase